MLSSIAFNKNWSQMVAEETDKIFKTEVMLPDEDMPVLSAILNSLSALLEKFKINWIKSLERTCLLKITSSLLQNTNLSSIVSFLFKKI